MMNMWIIGIMLLASVAVNAVVTLTLLRILVLPPWASNQSIWANMRYSLAYQYPWLFTPRKWWKGRKARRQHQIDTDTWKANNRKRQQELNEQAQRERDERNAERAENLADRTEKNPA